MTEEKNVGLFFRTHLWNSDAERAYRRISANWGDPVFLALDDTNNPTVPNGLECFRHDSRKFSRYNLPSFPSVEKTLWYNGDYIIYDIALNSDFDYFVICEFDLVCPSSLKETIQRIVASGAEFVVHRYGKAPANWWWRTTAEAWYAFEGAQFDPAEEVNHCILPFIFCSRKAALKLFSRRMAMSFLREREDDPWMFCETFVATEAARLGLNARRLEDFATANRLVFSAPTHWNEVPSDAEEFIHPVLTGDAFVAKLFLHAKQLRDAGSDWLQTQRERCADLGELEKFDEHLLKSNFQASAG